MPARKPLHRVHQYARDVLKGRIVVGPLVCLFDRIVGISKCYQHRLTPHQTQRSEVAWPWLIPSLQRSVRSVIPTSQSQFRIDFTALRIATSERGTYGLGRACRFVASVAGLKLRETFARIDGSARSDVLRPRSGIVRRRWYLSEGAMRTSTVCTPILTGVASVATRHSSRSAVIPNIAPNNAGGKHLVHLNTAEQRGDAVTKSENRSKREPAALSLLGHSVCSSVTVGGVVCAAERPRKVSWDFASQGRQRSITSCPCRVADLIRTRMCSVPAGGATKRRASKQGASSGCFNVATVAV